MDANGELLWGKRLDMYLDPTDEGSITELDMVGNGSGELFVQNSSVLGSTKSITKLTSAGEVLWSRKIMLNSTTPLIGLRGVKADNAGGCWFAADGESGPLVLGHLDSMGGLIWCKQYAFIPGALRYRDIAISMDGTIVVSASLLVSQQALPMLMRLDAQGTPLWSKRYGAAPFNFGPGEIVRVHESHEGLIFASTEIILTMDHDGGLVSSFGIAPTVFVGDTTYGMSLGGYPIFTDARAILPVVGTPFWAGQTDWPQDFGLWNIPMIDGVENSGGFCSVIEWTGNSGPVDLDSILVSDAGHISSAQALISDSWVELANDSLYYTTDHCLLVPVPQTAHKPVELGVHPTLIDHDGSITINAGPARRIMLFDLSGRTLKSFDIRAEQTCLLPMAGLASGIYTLVAQATDNGRASARIVVR
jgi:hypothetical protein